MGENVDHNMWWVRIRMQEGGDDQLPLTYILGNRASDILVVSSKPRGGKQRVGVQTHPDPLLGSSYYSVLLLGSGTVRGVLSSLKTRPSALVALTSLFEDPSVVSSVVVAVGCCM